MQRILNYFLVTITLTFCAAFSFDKARAQDAEVSYQVFYDQLSPYGHWVDFPGEGNVWVPNAEEGFSPYQSHGYWAYTDYGWTWVSDYRWGWAPFHYGRWDFDDDYGWYWVPQYEWAPAWVAWSRSPGYYGWAPLRPGIDIDVAIGNGYYVPHEHWCYVHEEYLGRRGRDFSDHFAPRSENVTIIQKSTMINNTYIDNSRHTTYIGGPARADVEKSTGAPLKQLPLVSRSTPGQTIATNRVSMYKPVVAQTTASDPHPAPPAIASIRDLKPLPGRTPNPERLSAAPPAAAPVQQAQSRPNATPPAAIKQNQNTQAAPQMTRQNQNTQAAPQARPTQQTPPVQTAPRENPAQQPPQQTQQSAPQQSVSPRQQRNMRYVPPQYHSPAPISQPTQAPPTRFPAPMPRNNGGGQPRGGGVQPRQGGGGGKPHQ